MTEKEKETNPVEEVAEAPVETAEAPAEAATETPAEAVEKPKHRYADRLSKIYPDRKFESDEDMDNAVEERFNENESFRERANTANEKLIALFEAEPQVGAIVRDMLNGASFREALARHVSPEDLVAAEGAPDYEGWNKNKSAREEAAAKRKAMADEYNANLEFSQQAVTEFAAENNMTEEAAEAFLGKVDEMLAAVNSGKVSKEFLTMMNKAFNHDAAVQQARETGEIAGKNQKIVATKQAEPIGDGLPKVTGSSEVKDEKPKQKGYFENLIEKQNRTHVV